MAKHDQTFVSRSATVNVSVVGAPSHAYDIVLFEMDTSNRHYSYISFESLTTEIFTNDKLLISSIIENEEIMYLWKPPSDIITSSNTKEGGSANLYLEMTSRSPLSELYDRISIVLTTSKCRTYFFNDHCCWTKWDKLLPHTPQTLSIQPPTETVLTSREAMNFRTPRQLLCTAEHMSIHHTTQSNHPLSCNTLLY